jgi:phosphatidylserine/phosphatidylglycerophosphate/cardiolipin synthase-like enzyme
MGRCLILGVILLMGSAGTTTMAAGAHERRHRAAVIRVYFSPRGGCTEALVGLISHARRRIDVQAYSFTSPTIAEALIAASGRGVAVRIVLDGGQLASSRSLGPLCRRAGIPVVYDTSHAIAHNKVVLIDGRTVVGGSFNFTQAAERRNAENMTVIRHRPTCRAFRRNFESHLAHSRM